MKRGHDATTVFLVWHARFCEKVLLRGQKFVPATCCMKFSWFEFLRHEAGTKWPHDQFSVCTALANCPRYNTDRNELISTSCAPACALPCAPTVPATCVLCVHTQGLVPLHVPATCPLVCADFNSFWLCCDLGYFTELIHYSLICAIEIILSQRSTSLGTQTKSNFKSCNHLRYKIISET